MSKINVIITFHVSYMSRSQGFLLKKSKILYKKTNNYSKSIFNVTLRDSYLTLMPIYFYCGSIMSENNLPKGSSINHVAMEREEGYQNSTLLHKFSINGPQWGERGQNFSKDWPNGLWMTP